MYRFVIDQTFYFLYDSQSGLKFDYICFNNDTSITSSLKNFPTHDTPSQALKTFFLVFLPGIGSNALDLNVMALEASDLARKASILRKLEKLSADSKEADDKRRIEALQQSLTGLVFPADPSDNSGGNSSGWLS